MNTVTVTETKNQVTVNETTNTVTVQEGVATVVTVKTEGPQGPIVSDGDKGDITVANNGTSVTVNAGAIDNANIASNAAIDLTKLATGALPTAITVTSANISDLSIVNADINASAAIQGTKISPDFGSQNIVTTGTLSSNDITVTDLNPQISLVDSNNDSDFQLVLNQGIFRIRDTTNNHTDRLTIASNGTVGVIGNLDVGAGIDVTGNITVTGTVDGRDVAADGTKLDGIEANAINASNTAITNKLPLAGGTITGNLTVGGNFTVNGTTTTIDTTTLTVEDKNIELGKVSTPTDTTADGGGLTLKGATDKTFQWLDATDSFTSSEHIALPDNKKLQLGTSQDLILHHDGTHSKIHTETGNLSLSSVQKVQLSKASGDGGSNYEKMVEANVNSSVDLYFDNSIKFSTTSTGANLPDNTILSFGNGQDLKLRHDGTHNYVHGNTGNLSLSSPNKVQLSNASGDGSTNYENMVQAIANGSVELYYDNSKKFETTLTGIKIPISANGQGMQLSSSTSTYGQIDFDANRAGSDQHLGRIRGLWNGTEVSMIAFQSGTDTTNKDDGFIEFRTRESGGSLTKKLEITSDGNVQIPNDNAKLQIGASQDLEIYHNSANTIIENKTGNFQFITTSTGQLRVRGHAYIFNSHNDQEGVIKAYENSQVELYYDGVKKLETTSTGITATGTEHKFTSETSGDCTVIIEADTDNNNEADNPRIIFRQDGGLDLSAIHTSDNVLEILNSAGTTGGIKLKTGTAAGAVNGFSNAVDRLVITPDGNVQIPADNAKLQLGASQDLQIYHDSLNSYVKHDGAGGLVVYAAGSGEDLFLRSADDIYIQPQAGENGIKVLGNGAVQVYFDSSKKFETTSGGVSITGILEASADLRAQDIYIVADNKRLRMGAGQDFQLLHSGTQNQILAYNYHDTVIKSRTEIQAVFKHLAGVELNYATNKKLETTSTGVDVTGKVSENGVTITSKATALSLVFS